MNNGEYRDPGQGQTYYPPMQNQPSRLGLVAMILGIAGLATCTLECSVAAIILACFAKSRDGEYNVRSKTGLITGIVGAALSVVMMVVEVLLGFFWIGTVAMLLDGLFEYYAENGTRIAAASARLLF